MTGDFQVTIHNREIYTLWDTRALKSVICEECPQKIQLHKRQYTLLIRHHAWLRQELTDL